jgi:hypothetical protein
LEKSRDKGKDPEAGASLGEKVADEPSLEKGETEKSMKV